MHVSSYVEELTAKIAPPSVKQKLSALRMLFDWLVVHQVFRTIPRTPSGGRSMS